MPTYAAENLAGQLPTDPQQPPADPNPDPPLPDALEPEDRPQRMPIPGWSQPYLRTTGRKSPAEWGNPDYILQGARQYPGIAPGPWMPQTGDVRNIVRQTGMFFAQNGSIPNQLLAGQMLAFNDRWAKDVAAGMTARANLNLKEFQLRQYQLAEQNEKELRLFAETHAAYKDDPERLRQEWLNLSYQINDPVLRDVLQTQGVKRAEEVLSERHNNNLDQLKIIHQRLQNDKLQEENDRANRLERDLSELNTQQAGAAETKSYLDTGEPNPSSVPNAGISSDPTKPLGTPASTPTIAAPVPAAITATPAQPAAEQPTAPQGGWPAGLTPQNAAGRRAELVDYANRNGVSLPPADSAGLANWVAANQPAQPPSTTQPAPAATQAQPPATDALAPATRLAQIAGMSADQLDRNAWRYYLYGDLPNRGPVPKEMQDRAYRQNEAVKVRAMGSGGISEWVERLFRSLPQQPGADERASVARADSILDKLAVVQPGLAGQLRQIVHGDVQAPTMSGFGVNSRGVQMIRDLVGRLDTTWSANRFLQNQLTVRNFTNGQQAQRISAFKTALLHANTMQRIIDQMPNTSIVDYNRFLTNVRTRLGDPTAVEFNSAFQLFSTEVARAFRGSQTTLSEITHIRENLNVNASPAQMKHGLRVMIELMSGQLSTLADEYNRGRMKNIKGEDFFIDPNYKNVYHRLLSTPLLGSEETRGFAPVDHYRTAGTPTYDSSMPDSGRSLNQWLSLHRNHPDAARLREKLRSLGWLSDENVQ